MKNSIAFQILENEGYRTILKFRVKEDGKGEFYDLIPEYGKNYADAISKIGITLSNNKTYKPLENPEKFLELAPVYNSGTYERWVKTVR